MPTSTLNICCGLSLSTSVPNNCFVGSFIFAITPTSIFPSSPTKVDKPNDDDNAIFHGCSATSIAAAGADVAGADIAGADVAGASD